MRSSPTARQRGIAMIVSLVLLVIVTLLALGSLRGVVLQSRMSGTTTDRSLAFAAAEAGVPSVVCSFFADQPFWGSRIAALGVGTHVPFVKLKQRTLHAALQRALSEDTRSNAAELGRKLRNEDGNAKALDALERIVRSGAHAASAT